MKRKFVLTMLLGTVVAFMGMPGITMADSISPTTLTASGPTGFSTTVSKTVIISAGNPTTYSTVSLDTSEAPSGVGVAVTPGSYTGSFDRSVDRTFGFEVTLIALAPGTHTFNIYATVDGGRVATESDSISAACPAPTITCPANMTVECGTPTNYPPPIVSSPECPDDLITVICTPASGSIFPVGTDPVTCTATNIEGSTATCHFEVTAVDTTPPTVTCPADITTETATCTSGEVVDYIAIFSDSCGLSSYSCTPPSGSNFPVGTTTATCTGTDVAGNSASCTFGVTVNCVNPICRTAGFWGTHACPETITPIVPGDPIGIITGETCEQKGGSCAQNITQAVIDRCGACIDACGEDLTNTALGDENSAVEALCVGPTGNIMLQLARQLAATALNCCVSGSDGTCAGISIEPIFTACNSACDARKEAYASNSSFLKGPITATIGSDTFDCIKALDCFNNGGVPTPGFCATGTCSDNGALCASNKLTLCANPSTATCVPNTDNCQTRDLPLEDLGLTNCKDSDGSLHEGATGSSNECNAAQNNDCAFLPAPFDPEIYDCGAKVKVKGVGTVLNQGKECCDTRVNCVNDDDD